MGTGFSRIVSVTLRNTGESLWSRATGYFLGAQTPALNNIWGLSRVELSPSETIAPGQEKTFTFVIHAPATPGTYSCDWQMAREGLGFFGQTVSATVNVSQAPPPIDVVTNQATYHAGNTLRCFVGVTNPNATAQTVWVQVWLELRNGNRYGGWDFLHKVTIPPNETRAGKIWEIVLPAIPGGTYTFHGEMRSLTPPHAIIAQDLAPWNFE